MKILKDLRCKVHFFINFVKQGMTQKAFSTARLYNSGHSVKVNSSGCHLCRSPLLGNVTYLNRVEK